jgi:hypothetical protein
MSQNIMSASAPLERFGYLGELADVVCIRFNIHTYYQFRF